VKTQNVGNGSELTKAKFIGYVQGRRIYSEARGLNHVQHPARPNEASFTGSIKEIEQALHGRFVRFAKSFTNLAPSTGTAVSQAD